MTKAAPSTCVQVLFGHKFSPWYLSIFRKAESLTEAIPRYKNDSLTGKVMNGPVLLDVLEMVDLPGPQTPFLRTSGPWVAVGLK